MIDTNNIILYNRYRNDISLIRNHTNITAAEIRDKMNKVQFSLEFKTTYEEQKQKTKNLKLKNNHKYCCNLLYS
jgi:hypothetical protein